jgi:hypothetical protein
MVAVAAWSLCWSVLARTGPATAAGMAGAIVLVERGDIYVSEKVGRFHLFICRS